MILLDASALIALLNDEAGADAVAEALAGDEGGLSVVNLVEVLEYGVRTFAATPAEQLDYLRERVTIVPVTEADAVTAAELYPVTRQPALSLADRLALATARRLGVQVLTAERAWAGVPDVEVRLIR
ncbi:MAG TPA: PIN domain-containing protein [Acidimicrobiales bacterium]|nr:PIN domain-containing protein [Acidimicrobiales bacterium]